MRLPLSTTGVFAVFCGCAVALSKARARAPSSTASAGRAGGLVSTFAGGFGSGFSTALGSAAGSVFVSGLGAGFASSLMTDGAGPSCASCGFCAFSGFAVTISSFAERLEAAATLSAGAGSGVALGVAAVVALGAGSVKGLTLFLPGISIGISTAIGRGWVSNSKGKPTTPMSTSTTAPIRRCLARLRIASTLSG